MSPSKKPAPKAKSKAPAKPAPKSSAKSKPAAKVAAPSQPKPVASAPAREPESVKHDPRPAELAAYSRRSPEDNQQGLFYRSPAGTGTFYWFDSEDELVEALKRVGTALFHGFNLNRDDAERLDAAFREADDTSEFYRALYSAENLARKTRMGSSTTGIAWTGHVDDFFDRHDEDAFVEEIRAAFWEEYASQPATSRPDDEEGVSYRGVSDEDEEEEADEDEEDEDDLLGDDEEDDSGAATEAETDPMKPIPEKRREQFLVFLASYREPRR